MLLEPGAAGGDGWVEEETDADGAADGLGEEYLVVLTGDASHK